MSVEKLSVVLFRHPFHPLRGGLYRVDANVCFGIVEVGVKIHFVVGVGSKEKHHLVGTFHRQCPVGVAHASALGNGPDAYAVFHVIVVETAGEDDAVVAVGCEAAVRSGVWMILQTQVLASAGGGSVAEDHHVVGVGYEGAAFVADAVGCPEVDGGECTVDAEGTDVVAVVLCGNAGLDAQVAQCGVASEGDGVVGNRTVEVVLGQPCGSFKVVFLECASDILKDFCSFFVRIPIEFRPSLGIRSSQPK